MRVWALALVATVGFVSAIYFAFRAHQARLSAAASIAELSIKERELSENSSRAILSRFECHCHTTGQICDRETALNGCRKRTREFQPYLLCFGIFLPATRSTNRSQRSSAITSIKLETERFSKDAICSSLFRCSSRTVRLSFPLLLFVGQTRRSRGPFLTATRLFWFFTEIMEIRILRNIIR